MSGMSNDDQQFLAAMIKHHQAALDMSREYLAKSDSKTRQARVADLARNIIKAQTAEIDKMQAWLNSAGIRKAGASAMKM